jgi:adenosylcobinamide-GDP ribazoletransferase
MMAGLITALRTLTVLPVPGREAVQFSSSLYWFTFVGLLLGVVEAGLAWIGMSAGWPELAALLPVIAGILITRGLHADGLADLADGFFGGRTRESVLRIMKDPNVGSFGALALMLLLFLKWVSLLRIVRSGGFGIIVSGVMLARMAQVVLAARLPYARPEGGTASVFVNGAGLPHLWAALVSGVAMLFLLMRFEPVPSFLLLLAALGTSAALGLLTLRRIGGVTGDVLGAASEITEALVWTVGALLLR